MKYSFLFAIILIGMRASAGTAEPEPSIVLTLPKAIEMGLTAATNVLKAKNTLNYSSVALLQGYAQFLPDLTLAGSYGRVRGAHLITGGANLGIVDTAYNGTNYQVSSTLNIFSGYSDMAKLNVALSQKKVAEWNFKRVQQQVALDITQSYLQVILDQQIQGIGEHNFQVSNDRLKLLQAQKTLGAVSSADLYRQQAQVAQDQQYLIRARDRVKVDLLSLLQRLRLDANKSYSLEPPDLSASTVDAAPEFSDKLVQSALEKRQDFRAIQANTEAAMSEVKLAKSAYWPRLDLTGSYGGAGMYFDQQLVNGVNVLPPSQNSLDSQLQNQRETAVFLNLTWNIFDRWSTKQNVERANVVADNTRIDRDDLKNEIVVEIKQSIAEYISAIDQLASSKIGLEAAEKAFAVIEGRYKLGASNFIDLAIAQSNLLQAQALRAQSVIDYRLKQSALKFAEGDEIQSQ